MASVSLESSGKFSVRFRVDGKETRLRGFGNRRDAQRFAGKVDDLLAAKKTGSMPAELTVWVDSLEKGAPNVYSRLAAAGLVPERQKQKTLKDLLEAHRKQDGVIEDTKRIWDGVSKNLLEFFGEEKEIEKITQADAAQYEEWLRTAPLNRRPMVPAPYGSATVGRRIRHTKTVFTYAEKLGWLERNPFRFLRSGCEVNANRLEYVPMEQFLRVVDAAPLKWKLILCLGRLCGLRGSSEMFAMEWGDVHLSTADEPGWLAVRACKTKRHGRTYRVVPLPLVVEKYFIAWAELAEEGGRLVFPSMKKKTNFSEMTEKTVRRAGVPCWKNCWYNLRKSFCTDLLPVVKDILVYEQITDHSYAVAAQHYQILHEGRMLRGMDEAFAAFQGMGRMEYGHNAEFCVHNSVHNPSTIPSTHGIAYDSTFSQQDSQVPQKCGDLQEESHGCDSIQTGLGILCGLMGRVRFL